MINNSLKIKVMLHTFMDSLRVDENRTINHHGQQRGINDHINANGHSKRIKVFPVLERNWVKAEEAMVNPRKGLPSYKDMTQRNEEDKVKAVETFYEKARVSSWDYLEWTSWATKQGIPAVIITFTIIYWSYGLYFYYNPSV